MKIFITLLFFLSANICSAQILKNLSEHKKALTYLSQTKPQELMQSDFFKKMEQQEKRKK